MATEVEAPEVNDLGNYTKGGITYVYVIDSGQAFELIEGEWQEKAPF